MTLNRREREIEKLQERAQHLTIQLQTAEVDRDYYRAHRDRWKEQAVEAKQALRQIVQAAESESPDRLDAILRIARVTAGP